MKYNLNNVRQTFPCKFGVRSFSSPNPAPRKKRHASGIILLLKEYQESDKNYRTEREEIEESNHDQPDPNRFLLVGCFSKDVCKACDVLLVGSITDNDKEKKNDQA